MLNNNHLHVHPASSHYISDLYMVKRHFNEVITEHNPNHQHIPHQPSPNSGKSLSDEMRCVKRTHDRFPVSNHVPTAVRRNERERNRVKMVNLGFSTLRQHVPNGAKNKKMSKVETLRSAVDYIKQLQKVLGEGYVFLSLSLLPSLSLRNFSFSAVNFFCEKFSQLSLKKLKSSHFLLPSLSVSLCKQFSSFLLGEKFSPKVFKVLIFLSMSLFFRLFFLLMFLHPSLSVSPFPF